MYAVHRNYSHLIDILAAEAGKSNPQGITASMFAAQLGFKDCLIKSEIGM